jgi:amino acid transporter
MENSAKHLAAERAFLDAERRVALRSGELKKELRLSDLVLTQIAYILGFSWLAYAARLGPGQILYWIPAVLLFYIPSGIVVLHLSQQMPLEGGIYQWAKLRLGALPGFLVGVNLWATVTLLLASAASGMSNDLSYAAGPGHDWIVGNRFVTIGLGAALVGGLMLIARRGLSLGKWFQNAAGLLIVGAAVMMVLLALPRWLGLSGTVASPPIGLTPPPSTLLNLNLLGKMGFGAFCGLDGTSIFAGETRDPDTARTIRRSIFLAGPLIAIIYIVGTACLLTFTPPGGIDMTSPTMQAISRGAHDLGIAGVVVPLVTVLGVIGAIGAGALSLNVASRLPMVAGWDHLLPDWFSRLHPRFKTPSGSILFIGLMTLALTVLVNLGVGGPEAFQTSFNAALICWALTYMVMFSIPLIARGDRAPVTVRLAAGSGLVMTVLYAALSIFPVIDVEDPLAFTLKVGGIVLGLNAAGALYYMWAGRRIVAA